MYCSGSAPHIAEYETGHISSDYKDTTASFEEVETEIAEGIIIKTKVNPAAVVDLMNRQTDINTRSALMECILLNKTIKHGLMSEVVRGKYENSLQERL
jgi:hypothetical protein